MKTPQRHLMLTTIGLKYFPDQGPVHTRPHQILLQRTGVQNVILRTGLSFSPLENFFGDVLSRPSWVTESCCARHQSLSAWPTWQLFQTFSLASSSTNLCRFYCIPSGPQTGFQKGMPRELGRELGGACSYFKSKLC